MLCPNSGPFGPLGLHAMHAACLLPLDDLLLVLLDRVLGADDCLTAVLTVTSVPD